MPQAPRGAGARFSLLPALMRDANHRAPNLGDRPGHDAFRLRGRAARREAGPRRRGLPLGRAPLRPDERPHVGRHAPGLEADLVSMLRPPAHRAPSAISTSRAAPATSPSGSPRRAGRTTSVTVPTSTAGMLARRPRAGREARRGPGRVRRGECRGAAFRRRELRRLHHRLRHPERAPHRAALAEAHRVLKPGSRFLCLEFSRVDVPGLDALYEAIPST